jgi:hypothetical protein
LLVYDAISHGISFSKGSYVVVQDYQTTTSLLATQATRTTGRAR